MNLFQTTQKDQWTGSSAEIEAALIKAKADTSRSGQFVIAPRQQAASLFGRDEDILVTNQILYFRAGKANRLVDLLISETKRPVIFNQPQ